MTIMRMPMSPLHPMRKNEMKKREKKYPSNPAGVLRQFKTCGKVGGNNYNTD